MNQSAEPLAQMFVGYIEAALWSSSDGDGMPLDEMYGVEDFAVATLESLREAVAEFYVANQDNLVLYLSSNKEIEIRGPHREWQYAGHDLWLTGNHHGAGFWDRRGVSKAVGDALTKAAHELGGVDLYVGDDGKIYF